MKNDYIIPLSNNNGAALLVTLALISVLIAAAFHLSKTTGESVLLTLQKNDVSIAREMAMSGIHLSKMLLIQDAYEGKSDSVQDIWADPGKVDQAIQLLGFQEDSISLTIADELGKIQINALITDFPGNQINVANHFVLEQFFELRIQNDTLFDDRNYSEITNSIKDWLDSKDDDTITGLSGAESDYYQNQINPYSCANGPVNHISELTNIRGLMGLESFPFETYFTIYGLSRFKSERGGFKFPGKININTANTEIIQAILPKGMEDLAQDLVDYRVQTDKEHGSFTNKLDKGWYEKVIDLSKSDKKRIKSLVTYSSNIFKVTCKAENNTVTLILTAYIKREKEQKSGKWICRILQLEQA